MNTLNTISIVLDEMNSRLEIIKGQTIYANGYYNWFKREIKAHEDNDCLICLTPVNLQSEGTMGSVCCGTVFHMKCIITYLGTTKCYTKKNNIKCPSCQNDFKTISLANDGKMIASYATNLTGVINLVRVEGAIIETDD